MKKFQFASKEEIKWVRWGLKVARDSLKCGPDYTNYEPYGPLTQRQLTREIRTCKAGLKVVNELLKKLKGM